MTSAALERVELSRERLRRAMRPPPTPARARRPGPLDPWLQRLRALPLIGEMMDSVAAWWAHHPLRPISQVAGQASNAVARPLAQRHPLLLVLAAGLLGAGLGWSRPWRWIFRSALFAGLVPQLAARVAANLPIDSWLAMLTTALAATPPPETFRGDTRTSAAA
jgi:hypothetical protein